jgi:adenylyltransferase/sulfurtransferase
LTPADVRPRLLASDGDLVLLDVREPEEVRLARVPGALEIPMSDLRRRLGELDRTKEIVVLCHAGMRSQFVAEFLFRSGFPRVANVVGGIDAWARTVDPSVGTY